MIDTRFKVCVNIDGEKTEYLIPTGFNDITFGELVNIEVKYSEITPETILKSTGIPTEHLMEHELNSLLDLCSFVHNGAFSLLTMNPPDIDFENEPFIKWANMSEMIQKKKSHLYVAECVYNVYKQQSIMNDKASEILPTAIYLIKQVETVLAKYPKTSTPVSKYAAKAQVHRIERFGLFATVFELSGCNLTEFEKNMNRPTHLILHSLSYLSLKANINHLINESV